MSNWPKKKNGTLPQHKRFLLKKTIALEASPYWRGEDLLPEDSCFAASISWAANALMRTDNETLHHQQMVYEKHHYSSDEFNGYLPPELQGKFGIQTMIESNAPVSLAVAQQFLQDALPGLSHDSKILVLLDIRNSAEESEAHWVGFKSQAFSDSYLFFNSGQLPYETRGSLTDVLYNFRRCIPQNKQVGSRFYGAYLSVYTV